MACSVSSLSFLLDHSHLSVLNWSKRFGLSFHVFLIDSSATLIISSFFLARSLSLTPLFTCRNLLSSTLTFSFSSFLVLSLLYFPLLPLTLSCFYPNHEKILEQRKKGWSTEPLSVRWFFSSFNNHTGCEEWVEIFGRGKQCLQKLYIIFFFNKHLKKNQTDKRMDFFDRERTGKRTEAAWFKIAFKIRLTLKLQFCNQLLTSMFFWNPYDYFFCGTQKIFE